MRNLLYILCFLFLTSCERNKTVRVIDRTSDKPVKVGTMTPDMLHLTEQERIMGLVVVYQAALQHFAWFERVPDLDWSQAFMEYLPAVQKEQALLSYYRTLQRFAALLQDGHTRVLLPEELSHHQDNLPFLMDYVANQYVVIERLPSQEILDEDIPLGSIILSINDQVPDDWLEAHVFPFVSNPTPHAKQLAFNFMRCFSKGEQVKVKLRYPNGSIHSRIISATRDNVQLNDCLYNRFSRPWNRKPIFRTEPMGKHIIYIRYGSCTPEVENEFVKCLRNMNKSEIKTIILDLRSNPGGDTPEESIQQLITQPLVNPVIMRTRCSISSLDASFALLRRRGSDQQKIDEIVKDTVKKGELPQGFSPGWYKFETHIEPAENGFGGTLILLINGETGSATEEFVAILKARERTIVIGERSNGSTGTPLYFGLPGGGKVGICTLRVCYPNGKTYIGQGIIPDIFVERSIEGIVQGKDELLQKALYVAEQQNDKKLLHLRPQ